MLIIVGSGYPHIMKPSDLPPQAPQYLFAVVDDISECEDFGNSCAAACVFAVRLAYCPFNEYVLVLSGRYAVVLLLHLTLSKKEAHV